MDNLAQLKKNHHDLRKANRLLLNLWGTSLILGVINFLLLIFLIDSSNKLNNLIQESYNVNTKILKLSKKTEVMPFFLEKYAFTLNSVYLQGYWRQLELDFTFENLTRELSKFDEFRHQIDKIKEVNRSLREEEVLSLKLMFTAYHIPEEVINDKISSYRLSEQQIRLSDNEKLEQSHDILFNTERQLTLQKEQQLIEGLRLKIKKEFDKKISQLEKEVNIIEISLIISSLALIVVILSILWLRLINKLVLLRLNAMRLIKKYR